MNKLLLLLLALGFLGGLSSCNLFRRTSGSSKVVTSVDSTQPIAFDSVLYPMDSAIGNQTAVVTPDIDPQQRALLMGLTPLWTRQREWTTFNGRAKTHYEGRGENHDFTATIRMERGKSIWISVVALGVMEAFRVMVNPDSIQVMDRLHKEYRALPFSQLGSLMPIKGDFASLQSMLIGDPINTSRQPNAVLDSQEYYLLSQVSPQQTQTLSFFKSDSTLRLQTIIAPDLSLVSRYDNYTVEGGFLFANTRSMSMKDQRDEHLIEMDFNKAAFNEAVEMPYTIPDKYDRK